MTRHYPQCRDTGKVRYPDQVSAKLGLAKIRAEDDPLRPATERRVYRCPLCGGFHLTSQR